MAFLTLFDSRTAPPHDKEKNLLRPLLFVFFTALLADENGDKTFFVLFPACCALQFRRVQIRTFHPQPRVDTFKLDYDLRALRVFLVKQNENHGNPLYRVR